MTGKFLQSVSPRFLRLRSLVVLLALVGIAASGAAQDLQDRTVRTVYLVSKDRPVRNEYRDIIAQAFRELRLWFGQQMGGLTFRLHDPVVEVVQANEPAAWFYGHSNGDNPDD